MNSDRTGGNRGQDQGDERLPEIEKRKWLRGSDQSELGVEAMSGRKLCEKKWLTMVIKSAGSAFWGKYLVKIGHRQDSLSAAVWAKWLTCHRVCHI